MENIPDPYIIEYPFIAAITDRNGEKVELIEFFDCIGGAMWTKLHYGKSPLVDSIRQIGSSARYILKPGFVDLALEGSKFPAGICGVKVNTHTIEITYVGIGGGGVGASVCRARAKGVISSIEEPSGGGRRAQATITLPRLQRVIVGVDDTDTPLEGATWTLTHNISKKVAIATNSVYLSHTIVQLFPVPYRTKNCVSIACEFATMDPLLLIESYKELLVKYTLSDETGMAVYTGFSPEPLMPFAKQVKRGEVDKASIDSLKIEGLSIILNGRGRIGAVAAIPFATYYDEALQLWNGIS